MRRWLITGLMVALAVCTRPVLATKPLPVGDQSATGAVGARAELPAFLEMTVQADCLDRAAQDSGDSAAVEFTHLLQVRLPACYDDDLSDCRPDGCQGKGDKTGRDSDRFLPVGGTFRTQVWSNLNYHYTVSVDGGGRLRRTCGDSGFPLSLRAGVLPGDRRLVEVSSWREYSLEAPVILVAGKALQTFTVFQQFRIPPAGKAPEGEYRALVRFCAATI